MWVISGTPYELTMMTATTNSFNFSWRLPRKSRVMTEFEIETVVAGASVKILVEVQHNRSGVPYRHTLGELQPNTEYAIRIRGKSLNNIACCLEQQTYILVAYRD